MSQPRVVPWLAERDANPSASRTGPIIHVFFVTNTSMTETQSMCAKGTVRAVIHTHTHTHTHTIHTRTHTRLVCSDPGRVRLSKCPSQSRHLLETGLKAHTHTSGLEGQRRPPERSNLISSQHTGSGGWSGKMLLWVVQQSINEQTPWRSPAAGPQLSYPQSLQMHLVGRGAGRET